MGSGPAIRCCSASGPMTSRSSKEQDRSNFRYVFEGQVRNVVFIGGILQMEVAVADEVLRVHAAGRSRFSLMQDAPETVTIGTSELVADPGLRMTGARYGRRREPVAAAGTSPDHRPPRPLARGAREHDRGLPPGDRARRRDDRG